MYDPQKIENLLDKLNETERILVNIIAFIACNITQTKTITFVSYLGLGIKIRPAEYNSFMDNMLKQGVIEISQTANTEHKNVNLLFGHYIMLKLAKNKREFRKYLHIMRDLYPPKSSWGYFNTDFVQIIARDIRAQLYSDNIDEARKLFAYYKSVQPQNSNYEIFEHFIKLILADEDGKLLENFNKNFINRAFEELLTNRKVKPELYLNINVSTLRFLHKNITLNDCHIFKIIAYKMFAEKFEETKQLENMLQTDIYKNYMTELKAFLITGNWEEVIKSYETAQAQSDRKNKKTYDNITDSIYFFTMLATQQHLAIPKVETLIKKLKQFKQSKWLEVMITAIQSQPIDIYKLTYDPELNLPLENLLAGLLFIWCEKNSAPENISTAVLPLIAYLETNRFTLLAWHLRAAIQQRNTTTKQLIESDIKPVPINTIFTEKEPWEEALSKLESINYLHKQMQPKSQERLIWKFKAKNGVFYDVIPVVQKKNKSGKWSKGRAISLKKLKEEGLICMTDQDIRIANYIDHDSYRNRSKSEYFLKLQEAIHEFEGHPLLFIDDQVNSHIEMVEGKLELNIQQTEESYELFINVPHSVCHMGIPPIYQESPTRLRFLKMNNINRKILQTFEDSGIITIPLDAHKQLQKTISTIADKVVINSDADIIVKETHTQDAKWIDPDPTIVIQIHPINDGFKLGIGVRPFSNFGILQPIGKGIKTLFETENEQRFFTKRNFKDEKNNYQRLVDTIPGLHEIIHSGVVFFDTPEECLNVLELIEPALTEHLLKVEWPKGGAIKISALSSTNNFKLKIDKKKNWFEINGEYEISENIKIGFNELLQKLEDKSLNYIQISEKEFMKITDEFRKKINTLETLVTTTKTGDNKLHKLAISAFASIFEDNEEIMYCKEWHNAVNKIKTLENFKPEIPSTFNGELRNYQLEGYKWLATLAEWGVGACLADDMGLGKTIQTLALILQKANKGPSIVVAPASVTSNWQSEAEKFAPELNPIQLRDFDRDKIINLKHHDLLITSYGLLNTTIAEISKVGWNILVFDEAQALKNIGTKRSKVARQVHADFKLLTTGTPLENNLGELWNLFDIINPGLLGSSKMFKSKFMTPIERDNNPVVKKTLRDLISPFILRRLKTNVLDELPEKTDITLTVEMNEKERAFYESLRQRAIERTEQIMTDNSNPGTKHLQVLAEITKLRQLCCNPLLLDSNSTIQSSKLEQFKILAEELIDNNHKALVFSQFVSHLKIIRKVLDEKNISYQYLDGSTPIRKREKAVKDFQSGKSDFFLISLKAGGTGLNLTAADYVIHMDPWWNPAVENQASDRAHRIGQKRPVTVYRIIVKNSIEEKIIELHEYKKELADSLLQDTEKTAKLNIDDLVKIIKEQ